MPFSIKQQEFAPTAVIAVRPESNKVTYESIILRGIAPYSNPVYIANLSGTVINNSNIIESQYNIQHRYARNGKKELIEHPEMIKAFEEKFKITVDKANIIGAFEAITTYKNQINKNEQELFHTIVGRDDFLECYGHTIKKIDNFYIINYDMPAVFSKHNKQTDIFVIAVKLKTESTTFADLNRSIYEGFCNNKQIAIIDSESRTEMEWFNQVRRTYHISNSHIKAMFDMTDYIINHEGAQLPFNKTPLGKILFERGKVTELHLSELKNNPMVYIKSGNTVKLINLLEEARSGDQQKNLVQCCELIESIQF